MTDDTTRSIDLVRRAQGGNREALNALFERYYPRVQRIVRVRLGKRLRERLDSGDILQETFGAAVANFDRFEMRDEASLIRWLATLVERQITTAADYHNAQKRDARLEVPLSTHDGGDSTTFAGVQVSAPARLPIDQLAEAEATGVVEECIRELPEDYRELILWRDYAAAEWETVAQATGRPSAAAARMMHARAMIELSKLVKKRMGAAS